MNDDGGVADRHLIPVTGLGVPRSDKPQFVRLTVADAWASTSAGQLMASCLVNLLCRQARVVTHVEIVAPTAPLLIALPSGATADAFPLCLEAMAAWAVDGAVTVTSVATTRAADHLILIGDVAGHAGDATALAVIGDGWRAWLGRPSACPRGVRPRSRNPLGPFLAAALAAGEIFKRICGLTRGQFLTNASYSLWSGKTAPAWSTLADGPEVAGAVLAPIHLVGTGAVGNGLAYILANMMLLESFVVAIDDDSYDKRNLNRCLVAGWRDLKQPKVNALATFLPAAGVGVFAYPGTIKSYLADPRRDLRADIARDVDNLEFGIVASCVDRGLSRQDVQSLRPRLLVGGSTLDLQAKANRYSRRPGDACLACYNRAERDGEKIRALERELRAMSYDARRHFLTEHALDQEAVEAYLASAECGGIGETVLRAFAVRPPAEFSVGFVSLGAALLLAASILRDTIFVASVPRRADMITLNFLNGGLMDFGLGTDPTCEWECQRRLHLLA